MAKNLRNIGALVSADALVSVSDGDGAYLDYDIAGTNARIGAKGVAGSTNRGLLIRTLSAGAPLTVLAFTAAGAATFANTVTVSAGGLTVSAGTTAVQALTATTGVFAGAITSSVAGDGISLTADSAAVNTTRAGITNSRFFTDASGAVISVDGVWNFNFRTGGIAGTNRFTIASTGALTATNTLTVSAGGLTVSAGTTAVQALTATSLVIGADIGTVYALRVNGDIICASTQLFRTTAVMSNGAGVATGTLANAPVAGNPTKWLLVNDNGTNRYVPAW